MLPKLPKSGLGWELLGKESPGVCLRTNGTFEEEFFMRMREKPAESLPLLIELINFSCTDVMTAVTLGNY